MLDGFRKRTRDLGLRDKQEFAHLLECEVGTPVEKCQCGEAGVDDRGPFVDPLGDDAGPAQALQRRGDADDDVGPGAPVDFLAEGGGRGGMASTTVPVPRTQMVGVK